MSKSGRHRTTWECRCSCGNVVNVTSDNLRCGRTTSCGCAKSEMLSKRMKTHGETNTKLYGVWSSIKSRCYNRNTDAYKDYGLRGISMCDEWRNSYLLFKQWACESGYSDGKSIDRIDNNLGYSPDNCRWVDAQIQANNRRSNRVYTIGNESHNVTEWASIYGINQKTLFTRIYSGLDIETAVNF